MTFSDGKKYVPYIFIITNLEVTGKHTKDNIIQKECLLLFGAGFHLMLKKMIIG